MSWSMSKDLHVLHFELENKQLEHQVRMEKKKKKNLKNI